MSTRTPSKTIRLPRAPKYRRLVIKTPDGNAYNPELRAMMHGRSGVYVMRKRGRKRPEYVGESHTGRAWKTMLRHLQGRASFSALGEWTHCCPSKFEVAFFPCAPSQARALEERAIARYRPTANLRRMAEEDGIPF